MTTKFIASYESDVKAQARARVAGWTGPDDEVGMLDYIDVHGGDDQEVRTFTTKDEAEVWLKAEIEAGKTLFGCGDIDVMEPVRKRCRYCVCNGWRKRASYIVDDTGIAEERDLPDDCWNGED